MNLTIKPMKIADLDRPNIQGISNVIGLFILTSSLSACSLALEEIKRPVGLIDERLGGAEGGAEGGESAGGEGGEMAGGEGGEMTGGEGGEMAGGESGEMAGDEAIIPPVLISEGSRCQVINCDDGSRAEEVLCDGLPTANDNQPSTCQGRSCYFLSNMMTLSQEELIRQYPYWSAYYWSEDHTFPPAEILNTNPIDVNEYRALPFFETTDIEASMWSQKELAITVLDCNGVASDPFSELLERLMRMDYNGFTIELPSVDEQLLLRSRTNLSFATCSGGSGQIKLTKATETDSIDNLILSSATQVIIDDLQVTDSLLIKPLVPPDMEHSGQGSEVVIKKLSIVDIQELKIDHSVVSIELEEPEEESLAPVQEISLRPVTGSSGTLSITNSVIKTNATIKLSRTGVMEELNRLNDVIIKDSTLIMTNPNEPLFDLDTVNVKLENVLVITDGQGFHVHESTLDMVNVFSLSVHEAETCAASWIKSGQNAKLLINGAYLHSCQQEMVTVTDTSLTTLTNVIAEEVKTLVGGKTNLKSLISVSEDSRLAPIEMSHLSFTGETLINLISSTENYQYDLAAWGRSFLTNPSPPIPSRTTTSAFDLDLSIKHVYAQNVSEGPHSLIVIQGGGAHDIEASHLVGEIFVPLSDFLPFLSIKKGLLDGSIRLFKGTLQLENQLFRELQVKVENGALFTLNQVAATTSETEEIPSRERLSIESTGSNLVMYRLQAQVALNLEGGKTFISESYLKNDSPITPLINHHLSGGLEIDRSQLMGTGTLLINGLTSLANITDTHFADEVLAEDESTMTSMAKIINRGELSLVNVLLEDEREEGAMVYVSEEGSLNALGLNVHHKSSYGVYVDGGQLELNLVTLKTIEDLSPTSQLRSQVALYVAEGSSVEFDGNEEAQVFIDGPIVFQSEEANINESGIACFTEFWRGDCPLPTEFMARTDDLIFESCQLLLP